METTFIIRNDISDMYKIYEYDSAYTVKLKRELKRRDFAIFDSETKHWTMQLPHFFYESPNEYKTLTIESFTYFKPDGSADIGTTLHSPTLVDGSYSQFDNMIGLSTAGIYKTFHISNNPDHIEFYFKDYMSNTCLNDSETIIEQKMNESGEYLYLDDDGNETTNVTRNPVLIEVEKKVAFIIMCKLVC